VRLLGLAVFINANGTLQLNSSGGRALTGVCDVFKGNQMNLGNNPSEGSEAWTESDNSEGIDLVSTTGGANGLATFYYIPN